MQNLVISFSIQNIDIVTPLCLDDHHMEYQIVDKISLKAFLNLAIGNNVLDEKTLWLFRERVTKTGLIEKLFDQFVRYLKN